jgi:hypothetical protein
VEASRSSANSWLPIGAVEVELLRPVAPFLLCDLSNADTLLRHPAVLTCDACGKGWHVFDVDPTVTTGSHGSA